MQLWPPITPRHRSRYSHEDVGTHEYPDFGILYGPAKTKVFTTHQVTWSRTNRGWPFLGTPWAREFNVDIGAPFRTVKVEVSDTSNHKSLTLDNKGQGSLRNRYRGALYPSQDVIRVLRDDLNEKDEAQTTVWFDANAPRAISDFDLDALGASAINRLSPTSPVVDSATQVAELLREGLPSIPGTQGNPGSEYLNYQFGIAPSISFAKDAVEAYQKAEVVLKQLRRDSGKYVRRSYDFEEERNTSTSVTGGTYPFYLTGAVPNVYVAAPGTLTKIVKTRKKVWFRGAFTYHFPEGGWSGKLAEWDAIYGIKPGIDTAYNLVPWSWLVDYFTNVGDILSNIQMFAYDGLVMPYAYVMCTQQTVEEHTWQGRLSIEGTWRDVTLSSTIDRVHKQRRPATPWGFGVTADLTDRQLLILAALGISRA